jgi:hypothetical protein
MSTGRISPDLPYIRKKAVEVLKVNYTTREVAQRGITSEIARFYQSNYRCNRSSAACRSETSWPRSGEYLPAKCLSRHACDVGRTHPNSLGHNDSPGCFRCHDGNHTSADGQTITNDCSACHQIVVSGEENPKILTYLALK